MKRLWIVLAILVLGLALLATACGSTEESTTTGAPTTATPPTGVPTTSGASTTIGAPTTAAADNGGAKQIVAVCLPAMDNPLMLEIKDTFMKNFGADYDVQVASADGNPNTQSYQVENYTAMKVKLHVRHGGRGHQPAARNSKRPAPPASSWSSVASQGRRGVTLS